MTTNSRKGEPEVAREIRTIYTDDIDGTDAVETVAFALDGEQYEIDLNASHAGALRDALAQYIKQGRALTKDTARGVAARAATPVQTPRASRRSGGTRRYATMEDIEAIKASRGGG